VTALPRHAEEIDVLLKRVGTWAVKRDDIYAVALVGSWARGDADETSDIDLVLLTDSPETYVSGEAWTEDLGATSILRTRSWGAVTERRFALPSGLEVDVAIASPSWATTTPVDPGTARVISDGIRVVFDPAGALARLVEVVTN
jgi:uncharacterized protein